MINNNIPHNCPFCNNYVFLNPLEDLPLVSSTNIVYPPNLIGAVMPQLYFSSCKNKHYNVIYWTSIKQLTILSSQLLFEDCSLIVSFYDNLISCAKISFYDNKSISLDIDLLPQNIKDIRCLINKYMDNIAFL